MEKKYAIYSQDHIDIDKIGFVNVEFCGDYPQVAEIQFTRNLHKVKLYNKDELDIITKYLNKDRAYYRIFEW